MTGVWVLLVVSLIGLFIAFMRIRSLERSIMVISHQHNRLADLLTKENVSDLEVYSTKIRRINP